MKFRCIGAIAAILVLIAAIGATALDHEDPDWRVHQHRTARQPDAGCTCDGFQLCTHLPLVVIETGGEEIPGAPAYDKDGHGIGFTQTEDGEAMLSRTWRARRSSASAAIPPGILTRRAT